MRADRSDAEMTGNLKLPTIPTTRLMGHGDGPIRAVKFSHDGKYCISAGHDRTVRLYNPTRIDPAHTTSHPPDTTATSQTISTQSLLHGKYLQDIPPALPIQVYGDGHTHPISAIDIDDSSTNLLSSSDKTLIVTDILTRKLKRRLQGHQGRINSVACSSSANILLSASYDGTVRIWDGRSFSPTPVQILSEATDSVSCVKILQDDASNVYEIMSSSIDGCLRTYDLRQGCVRVDDLNEGKSSDGHHHHNSGMAVTSFAITSEFKCSAASCLNGSIHLMERSSGTLLNTCFGGHTAGRYSLECGFTADDQYVATGSEDGSVLFYDFVSGEVVQTLRGHMRPSCSIACHPSPNSSSTVITSSYDGSAVVWTSG